MQATIKAKHTTPLYTFLKDEIELAKQEGKHTLVVDNSQGLSADTIHYWFPELKVGWDAQNRITISWQE